ncbi:pyrroline-5-carboxylate reductase [Shewanella gelidii]|uniref:Pyrroline-5-carboxylate reductase n=1 Tax=Shewanella gelidii TaxID=1642821 RepID=A0A917JMM2_9GAMM|nr:pyrroline-5-carboxylate reductase [Shewanella gelidii]MCL1097200.1 pyrroline-5-carboxylate reductase [Shewanella gelidii]GGI73237.1 pyrroline-5-carboxylate reductase [Shewanella gelidii]
MAVQTLCFIGAGNMTRSIVSGLVKSGYPAQSIVATNPSAPKLEAMKKDFAIQVSHDNLAAAQTADVIILSVKPQLMEQVCQGLRTIDLSQKLIITIAAGIEAGRYQDYFAQPITLIRTMPNTPTQLGVGMTGMYAGADVNPAQRQLCEQLMATGGETLWVDQENDLNQVIALAGSSPAYFFLFMESMLQSAQAMGMDEDKARALVQQAAIGAAQMVKQNPHLSLSELRQNVTSKGGTTAQAVETFEHGDLRGLVNQAMENCIKRAEEMAKQF